VLIFNLYDDLVVLDSSLFLEEFVFFSSCLVVTAKAFKLLYS